MKEHLHSLVFRLNFFSTLTNLSSPPLFSRFSVPFIRCLSTILTILPNPLNKTKTKKRQNLAYENSTVMT